jgi:hypothetical protein
LTDSQLQVVAYEKKQLDHVNLFHSTAGTEWRNFLTSTPLTRLDGTLKNGDASILMVMYYLFFPP